METDKCCYDCVFCIADNSPIEVGLQYVCIQRLGSIYEWNKPCKYFVEDKKDGNAD